MRLRRGGLLDSLVKEIWGLWVWVAPLLLEQHPSAQSAPLGAEATPERRPMRNGTGVAVG